MVLTLAILFQLRQGDHLSPLLFILIEELLSRNLQSLWMMAKFLPTLYPMVVPRFFFFFLANDIFYHDQLLQK